MQLNALGIIVQEEWLKTPIIRPDVELDEYIIMPNHIHGIIVIKENFAKTNNVENIPVGTNNMEKTLVGTHSRASLRCASLQRPPRSLGAIIAGFKSAATKRVNEARNMPGTKLWQSRFYDHIIRQDKDLNNIRNYIINNPMMWEHDEENKSRGGIIA